MVRFSLATALVLILACGGPPAEGPDADSAAPGTVEDVSPPDDAPPPVGSPEAGTITGKLGEEDRTWTALYRETERGVAATSTYQTRTVGNTESHILSVAGHVGTSMSPSGSLRITFLGTEALDACPCTVTTGTIEYVAEFPDDVWEAGEATVTIDLFHQTGQSTFGAEGSFSGVLTQPGAAESIAVEGTFDIRRIQKVGDGG